MYDAFDYLPPEGLSYEELEKLEEYIVAIRKQGLYFIEQYLIHWTSTGDGEKSYESSFNEPKQSSGYDFVMIEGFGKRHLCVKTTEGSFENKIHISHDELLQMKKSEQYDLYRVYEINGMVTKVRIAQNLKEFADRTLSVLEGLPYGVSTDSISISPTVLNFQNPIIISLDEL